MIYFFWISNGILWFTCGINVEFPQLLLRNYSKQRTHYINTYFQEKVVTYKIQISLYEFNCILALSFRESQTNLYYFIIYFFDKQPLFIIYFPFLPEFYFKYLLLFPTFHMIKYPHPLVREKNRCCRTTPICVYKT